MTGSTLRRMSAVILSAILWTFVPPLGAFFLSVFLIWWAFTIDMRILIGATIVVLFAALISAALGRQPQAEQMSLYVYYLILTTGIVLLVNSRSSPSSVQPTGTSDDREPEDETDEIPAHETSIVITPSRVWHIPVHNRRSV